MKKIFSILTCNFLVVLSFLFLSEFAVRYFCPQIKSQGTDNNIFADNLFYSSSGLKPNSSGLSNGFFVKVDQFGFREFATKIDRSKNSWLLLGDSATMGIGVESDSTFAGIIHSALDSINVLNPSLIGYNIEDYFNLFKYFVLENEQNFAITRVSIFWCLNDLYTSSSNIVEPGGNFRSLFPDLLIFFRKHSRLYFFLKTKLFDRPKTYFLFDNKFYDKNDPLFQNSIKKIIEINNLCKTKQIIFDLILLPYEYQLRKPYLNDTPQKILKVSLQNENIKILDLSQTAKRTELGKHLFLYGDGIHFSNMGHRLIANFMLRKY